MHCVRSFLAASVATLVFVSLSHAQHGSAGPDPQAGKIAKASDEPQKSVKRMQLPKGLAAEVWAAEPMLANPVAFCFDEQGRIYVVETFRLTHSVPDNRDHIRNKPTWLDDELACRTVADRVAMYKKHKYVTKSDPDRVRMLYSSKGSGKPDKATIFADGFNRPEDGVGAGVLAHRGNVYFTCIPDLWLLKDTKGEHVADVKKSLQTGYGVHVAFIGHDMHGLRIGPDGRLYFSIGDRGFHVEKDGKSFSQPDCGAVLRCNLDGTGLEIVHTGLRNPQELAFDKFGNLFTVDNNADGGDRARLTQIVDGADSGWRIGHQYLPKLGTWNSEKTWQPHNPDRSSYFVPPVANLIDGPSGLTYHPGVALLPEIYKDNFFVCDFRGSAGGSSIVNFTVKPKGATFELEKSEKFVKSVLATDCEFGPDGGFYVSDWVDGWGMPGKGRIYRIADSSTANEPLVKATQEIIAAGMSKRDVPALVELLSHPDMRVRLDAQFALAERKAEAPLEAVALNGKSLLARLHAIWGLGQLGRQNADAVKGVVALLDDPDVEVRANAAKVLGEAEQTAAKEMLVKLLGDPSGRVKFHSAIALGRIGTADVIPAIFDALKANNDTDPYLRHGLVVALTTIPDAAATLTKAADHAEAPVRLAAVLALRKLEHPGIAKFLRDVDPKIVLEAARGIYDTPIPAAMGDLAKLVDRPLPDPKLLPPNRQEYLLRRVAAANYRLGEAADASALANFAGKNDVPSQVRLEALGFLKNWKKPSGRDPVVGVWRPFGERSDAPVAAAVRGSLAKLMTGPDDVRKATAALAAQHGITEIGPTLRGLVADPTKPVALRMETLKALELLKDPGLKDAAEAALNDSDGRLRQQARRILLAKADRATVIASIDASLGSNSVPEQQAAMAWLAELKGPESDDLLAKWLWNIVDKRAAPELHLDILEAASHRTSNAKIKEALDEIKARSDKKDELAEYRPALVGGDADAGKKIFHDKVELSCVRCHKVGGVGGEVGPDLAGLSKRVKRDYILESIVLPNKQIAKGYETVVLVLKNGTLKTGILKSEDAKEVRLMNADGLILAVPTASIDERSRGPSAMPADLVQKMSRRELRDLVEYLSGL